MQSPAKCLGQVPFFLGKFGQLFCMMPVLHDYIVITIELLLSIAVTINLVVTISIVIVIVLLFWQVVHIVLLIFIVVIIGTVI